MAKLSVIIPSREERFLNRTLQDVFEKARGEIEAVVHLDGYWPTDWKTITDKYPNLHTVHSGLPVGMRGGINKAVGSAKSRGAKYIMKLDAHCMLDEGFDLKIIEHLESNWVVVPRRKRLDADKWTLTDTHKIDIDYHYLSFPDDPKDFGGKGLNGKPWDERSRERRDKPEYDIDDEMASQGSAWAMFTDYFYELELVDEASYGPFWNEAQEIFNKCWLSGGRCVVNKKTWYAHLHKGKTHGRGYRLPEAWLKQGATFTKNWIWNDAWAKQAKPFKWLIEHFWPVPSWPENWEEILYAERKPRAVVGVGGFRVGSPACAGIGGDSSLSDLSQHDLPPTGNAGLKIHEAYYGFGKFPQPDQLTFDNWIVVTGKLQSLVNGDSLDIVVSNSALDVGNPFRGKKKRLHVTYSIDGGEPVTVEREEKDWLIIGPVRVNPEVQDRRMAEQQTAELSRMDGVKKPCPYCSRLLPLNNRRFPAHVDSPERELREVNPAICKGSGKEYIQSPAYTSIDAKSGAYVPAEVTPINDPSRTPAALNDFLVRKFQISPQRLRGPVPIELRDFHRNDLARLFAELGFKRGAEIGVAEGNYSEVLLKANPECELLLVDPWHAYSENPQNKTSDKHKFAYEETLRKIAPYRGASTAMRTSMEAVREIAENLPEHLLDFVYIDGNHLFDYVIQDLVEWSKRVRSGGIVSGDDYYALDQKRWVGGGVVEAVQAYTNAHRIAIWYIFQGHKSVDFMWCKP